jgi:hypothetical protein
MNHTRCRTIGTAKPIAKILMRFAIARIVAKKSLLERDIQVMKSTQNMVWAMWYVRSVISKMKTNDTTEIKE